MNHPPYAGAGGVPYPPSTSTPSLHQPEITQPPGTVMPGTCFILPNYYVTVDRFLAEGGFAHVYLVSTNTGIKAVLKRVACPDDVSVSALMNEIDVHIKVSGHKNIVRFMDSCVNKANGGGYEVLILMEFCEGGHLVDFLNTRLDSRLTESEILRIFSDILEAIGHMHSLSPPIIHRDIKIENVLISSTGICKVCDFGSATTRVIIPGTVLSSHEIRILEDEIGRVTTLQYRSPELCDLYQKRGMTPKLDTWALGILLYKLCYFTTPFEDTGKLGILNARYKIPDTPIYTDKLKQLIRCLIDPDINTRWNVYQAYKYICDMRGMAYTLSVLPVPTVYESVTVSTMGDMSDTKWVSGTNVGDICVDNVTPMRRGRPPKSSISNPSHGVPNIGVSSTPCAMTDTTVSYATRISHTDLPVISTTSSSNVFTQQQSSTNIRNTDVNTVFGVPVSTSIMNMNTQSVSVMDEAFGKLPSPSNVRVHGFSSPTTSTSIQYTNLPSSVSTSSVMVSQTPTTLQHQSTIQTSSGMTVPSYTSTQRPVSWAGITSPVTTFSPNTGNPIHGNVSMIGEGTTGYGMSSRPVTMMVPGYVSYPNYPKQSVQPITGLIIPEIQQQQQHVSYTSTTTSNVSAPIQMQSLAGQAGMGSGTMYGGMYVSSIPPPKPPRTGRSNVS